MMRLTYYPFKPFEIENGKITIIETGNQEVFKNLILNFKDQKDDLHFSDNDFKIVETPKALHWFGDAFLQTDLNKLFQLHLYKQLKESITDEQLQNIFNLTQKLKSVVLESSYLLDLPLQVEEQTDLLKVFKFCDIHFESNFQLGPYGIIETILKTAVELKEEKIMGFMNVTDYLTDEELIELIKLVQSLNLPVILIKFSENNRRKLFDECRYYYIDKDYVEWD